NNNNNNNNDDVFQPNNNHHYHHLHNISPSNSHCPNTALEKVRIPWELALFPPSLLNSMNAMHPQHFGSLHFPQDEKPYNTDALFPNGILPPMISDINTSILATQLNEVADDQGGLSLDTSFVPTTEGDTEPYKREDEEGQEEQEDRAECPKMEPVQNGATPLLHSQASKKKSRKTTMKHDGLEKRENGREYASGESSSCVKGNCETGYRMVLEEPVHKDMLSCHQCKNKKKLDDIIICGHVFIVKHTMKTCTKKYCKSCLLRFYLETPIHDCHHAAWHLWKCPSCRFICCCAWCRKKKAKRSEEYTSLNTRANAHRLTPATSLARKLVTETTVDDTTN
ncbi:hypothetical protein RFI_18318, partial [Reticulomyxa filosa]